jgi:hypothetical protein
MDLSTEHEVILLTSKGEDAVQVGGRDEGAKRASGRFGTGQVGQGLSSLHFSIVTMGAFFRSFNQRKHIMLQIHAVCLGLGHETCFQFGLQIFKCR